MIQNILITLAAALAASLTAATAVLLITVNGIYDPSWPFALFLTLGAGWLAGKATWQRLKRTPEVL